MTAGTATETFIFPASPAQARLWLATAADPSGAAYNVTRAVRVLGRVDPVALTRAVQALVARHEALRTTFALVDDALRQKVSSDLQASITVTDLRANPDPVGACDVLLQREVEWRFDLEHGPLFRVLLAFVADDASVLCLNLHHLVCDGWSLSLLYRELGAAYAAAAAGVAPDLGPAPLQYADFSVWQQESRDPNVDAAVEFWTGHLGDAPRLLALPADRVRPAHPSGRGGRVTVPLPPSVAPAVHELARGLRTTPFVVLIAAFAMFLRRWTGSLDVPIGTPTNGRERVDVENTVGLFVNTIVPRFTFDAGESFTGLVASTRELMLEAMRHASAPFESVVASLPASRVPGVSPLFQVMFALQPVPADHERLGELRCRTLDPGTVAAKVDLSLVVIDVAGSFTASLEYSRDLFDEPTIAAAAHAFVALLTAALRAPETRLEDLPCAAPGERPPTVAEGPATGYPRDTDLGRLFDAVVARDGNAIAMEEGDTSISYADLAGRAAALAALLEANGVRPGDRVALMLPRGAAIVTAMLAVVKLGAVYVPVDPAYPEDRIRFMVEDCGARVAFARRPLPVVAGLRVLDVDGRDRWGVPERPSAVAIDAGAAALIIYTSGSTGKPKGVLVPHRAVARLVIDPDYLSITSADRVACVSNVSFDAATFEIWGALLNGATLVIVPPETVASPMLLERTISSERLSILLLTTAVFNRVAREAPRAFAPLRAVLFGGEASDPQAVAAIARSGRPRQLVHVYGPAEATTFATAWEVGAVDERAATVPIGRPIAATTTRVVDDAGRPVPLGVIGELLIGGDGVALGYHERPELTAERFIPDPLGPGRVYRTGDRCRVNSAGLLEFVCRADRQVKLRGFRIELAEIERVLRGHPAVGQAIVDVIGSGDTRRLVASVQPRAEAAVQEDDLRRYAATRLPEYMVPSAICLASTLPITPNGKIDRDALAGMVAAREARPARSAPRDTLELELVRIWEELLEVQGIGVRDDFFALGGHSLLAAAMLDRVERLFGRRVPLSTLLHDSTIEGLATALWRKETIESSIITALRESGSRPPLFFLHGDFNGGGFYSRRLFRSMDPAQPFYALAPAGAGGTELMPSIEAMADLYVAEIARIHPDGPIALGGYCNGALIAYEIATRLARTRFVTTVLMVHPSLVEPRLAPLAAAIRAACRLTARDEAARVRAMLNTIEVLRFLSVATPRQIARRVLSRGTRLLTRSGERGQPESDVRRGIGVRHDPHVWNMMVQAVDAFVPRAYEGRVALFAPPPMPGTDPSRGWMRAARGAVLIEIEGDHRTCVTTHAERLGGALEAELATAAAAVMPRPRSVATAGVLPERRRLVLSH